MDYSDSIGCFLGAGVANLNWGIPYTRTFSNCIDSNSIANTKGKTVAEQ